MLTGYFYLVVPTTPLWAVTSTDGSWVRVTRGKGFRMVVGSEDRVAAYLGYVHLA